MGFPYDQASWDVVDGVMFMGWGGGTSALYTVIGMVICVGVIWLANASESKSYKEYKDKK